MTRRMPKFVLMFAHCDLTPQLYHKHVFQMFIESDSYLSPARGSSWEMQSAKLLREHGLKVFAECRLQLSNCIVKSANSQGPL